MARVGAGAVVGMSATRREHRASLTGRDPAGYVPHVLHGSDRSYRETNCYSDIVIELLHARGLEPLAAFGHLVRMDFEGDQWTFFKPPPEDLERLFAVDIHEMQPYRPLPVQIAEQLQRDRTMIVELDSFHLPDTAATSYRSEHIKTSVAIDLIDPDAERMHYFHGFGLYALEGDDYRGVFRIGEAPVTALPPYAELVRFDAGARPDGRELRAAAREVLAHHLARRPASNPFVAFGTQLEAVLPALLDGELDAFHDYAFATVRMAGSAFEILADHSMWLFGDEARDVAAAAQAIVDGCKALSFRLARRRTFEPWTRVTALAKAWERMTDGLFDHVDRSG